MCVFSDDIFPPLLCSLYLMLGIFFCLYSNDFEYVPKSFLFIYIFSKVILQFWNQLQFDSFNIKYLFVLQKTPKVSTELLIVRA